MFQVALRFAVTVAIAPHVAHTNGSISRSSLAFVVTVNNFQVLEMDFLIQIYVHFDIFRNHNSRCAGGDSHHVCLVEPLSSHRETEKVSHTYPISVA